MTKDELDKQRVAVALTWLNMEANMNKLSAICLLACLTPNLAMGQAALEHHVWQDKRSFEPMSRTAQAITGPIKLSGNRHFATPGSKMTITFGNGKSAALTAVGASWRGWGDADHEKVTAEVFRLDHDPGKLEQGNTGERSYGHQQSRLVWNI